MKTISHLCTSNVPSVNIGYIEFGSRRLDVLNSTNLSLSKPISNIRFWVKVEKGLPRILKNINYHTAS